MSEKWTAASIPSQEGRVAVVTGANSGLGLAAARHLARAGARVVLACRSAEKGDAAAAAIRGDVPGAQLEPRKLDLADLASVSEFAERVAAEHVAIDLLLNNAGVMMLPKRATTADGFEMQLGTNHLGHFALTGRLLDALERGTEARVVTMSSVEARRSGRMYFDDLQLEHGYKAVKAYGQSKLSNLLFGLELDRRLRAAGSPVASLASHPGYSATNLQFANPSGPWRALFGVGNRLLAQSPEKGSLPMLYAATAPEAKGGGYYGPDGIFEGRGYPRVAHVVKRGRHPEAAARLWELSEQLTGVRYPTAVPAPR